MPSPPFDQSTCWKMRGMRPRVPCSCSRKSGTMSSVQPCVDVARGVGVDRGRRVVDEHELQLEAVLPGEQAVRVGLEAAVGVDDRRPAGPDVEAEHHGVVLHRLVARDALDRRQPLGRHVLVLLDGGDAGGVRRLDLLAAARQVGLGDVALLAAFREQPLTAGVEPEPDQGENDENDEEPGCRLELGLRLVLHGSPLLCLRTGCGPENECRKRRDRIKPASRTGP